MTVTVTVVASCQYTSSSNQPQAGAPSTVTVSCTPGSGKFYTARIENGNPAASTMPGKTTALLNTADIDASTRVFTISGRNDQNGQKTSNAGDGFIRLSLNY